MTTGNRRRLEISDEIDHTREYVPFLAYSKRMQAGGPLPEAETFAVIGATVAENFGVDMPKGTIGYSVLSRLQQ